MSIQFECQECGKTLKVQDEYAGRKTRCSGCKAVVKIPEASTDDVEDWDLEEEEEIPAPKSKKAAGSTKASSAPRSKAREAPMALPTRPKKGSGKKAAAAAKGGGIPLWVIIGGGVMGLLSVGAIGLVAMTMGNSQAGGSKKAASQEPQWVPTETYSKIGKFKMVWEMPPKWTQESGIEDEMWPWAHMKGQGMSIKLASNRSLTEMSSTMTSMGGAAERLMTAHTVRVAKLQAENNDYVETKPQTYKGKRGSVIWSDYEYKGMIGKGYGIRCTVDGPKLPVTLTLECGESARDKWRPTLLHIAGTVDYVSNGKDEDGDLAFGGGGGGGGGGDDDDEEMMDEEAPNQPAPAQAQPQPVANVNAPSNDNPAEDSPEWTKIKTYGFGMQGLMFSPVRKEKVTHLVPSSKLTMKDQDLHLLEAFPNLTGIDLLQSGITDEAAPILASLPKLNWLSVAGNAWTDAGTAELTRADVWVYLDFSGTQITDVTAQQLATTCPNLATLKLIGTRTSDAGLSALATLTGLKHLDVTNSWVTKAGVEAFKTAHPDCKVVSNPAQ